jgi:hypothetical protein
VFVLSSTSSRKNGKISSSRYRRFLSTTTTRRRRGASHQRRGCGCCCCSHVVVRSRAKRRERERRRGPLCFSSLFLCVCVRVGWLSFFSFVWSQKKIRKKMAKNGKKYTNTTKKKIAHAFDRKPAHSSTLPYGLFMREDIFEHLTVPGFEPGISGFLPSLK